MTGDGAVGGHNESCGDHLPLVGTPGCVRFLAPGVPVVILP